MVQKKMSDFPLSSHKYFDKGLGFYQKGGKKKSRGCLPKDPALLEFYDLILCKVAAYSLPLLSESHGIQTSVFSAAHATPLSEVRKKEQGM